MDKWCKCHQGDVLFVDPSDPTNLRLRRITFLILNLLETIILHKILFFPRFYPNTKVILRLILSNEICILHLWCIINSQGWAQWYSGFLAIATMFLHQGTDLEYESHEGIEPHIFGFVYWIPYKKSPLLILTCTNRKEFSLKIPYLLYNKLTQTMID